MQSLKKPSARKKRKMAQAWKKPPQEIGKKWGWGYRASKKERQNSRLEAWSQAAASKRPGAALSDHYTYAQALYMAKGKDNPPLGTVMEFIKWAASQRTGHRGSDGLNSLAASFHDYWRAIHSDPLTGKESGPTERDFVAMLQGNKPIKEDIKNFMWATLIKIEEGTWEKRPEEISAAVLAEARAKEEAAGDRLIAKQKAPHESARKNGAAAEIRTTARVAHFNGKGNGTHKGRETPSDHLYEIRRNERRLSGAALFALTQS